MDNKLLIFSNPAYGKIRAMLIDGEPHFVGKDAALALGYKDPDKALRDHVPNKYKLTRQISGSGQMRNMTLISEPGLYRLIFRSSMPAAEKMFDWVCEEVMPSLRKTGSYTMPNAAENEPDDEPEINTEPGAPLPYELEDAELRRDRLNLNRGIELRKMAKSITEPLAQQALLIEAANLIAGREILSEHSFYKPDKNFFMK